jgi:glycosyltransferase involved in cell wall biosynthesis
VPTSDVRALADRIAELLKDPQHRDQLGEQAAESAQDFGWEIIANRIMNVYQKALT